MATIRIAAAKSGIEVGGRHFGRSREFNIYIDGTRIGTVPNGQRQSFAIAAGAHAMFVKTDMSWTSHEHRFDMEENDSKAFHVQPSPNRSWLAVPLLVILLLIVTLGATKASGFFYVLPLLVASVSVVAIGKNPWLTLTEI